MKIRSSLLKAAVMRPLSNAYIVSNVCAKAESRLFRDLGTFECEKIRVSDSSSEKYFAFKVRIAEF